MFMDFPTANSQLSDFDIGARRQRIRVPPRTITDRLRSGACSTAWFFRIRQLIMVFVD